MRAIAVDWSGRASGAESFIWLAEVREGRVERLEGGRDRVELIDHLIELKTEDEDLIVGLDFAFSFPAWFVRRHGARTATQFWEVVARHGEKWLEEKAPPFAVRPADLPPPAARFRQTEAVLSPLPESVFALYGRRQVGRGSLRGMPHLTRLADAGFHIWPFQRAAMPLVVEIWPRLFAPIKRSARDSRIDHLSEIGGIVEPLLGVAASNDDVFDAAVSAIHLWQHSRRLVGLANTPDRQVEGQIWSPLGRG